MDERKMTDAKIPVPHQTDLELAAKEIATKTDAAMVLVREAQEIADKHGLSFNFGVAYGMGGSYTGARAETLEIDDEEWEASDGHFFEEDYNGWVSSSAHC